MMFVIKTLFALGISFLISFIGYRKKSLNLSGAIFALLTGYCHALSSYTSTVSMLTFFFVGSLVTKLGKNKKMAMEEDFKESGQRNWNQVFSNSFCSTLGCLVYIFEVGIQLHDIPINYQINPIGSACLIASVCCLAASCGDTLASEIGSVLSRSDPRLIVNFQKVPRGTNGGVSIVGTLSSGLGGFLVGISAFFVNKFTCNYFDLYHAPPQWPLIVIATMSGFIGSFIDSIFGSILQYSGINVKTGKIVHTPGPNIKYINGSDLLDNHNVNLISSTITGVLMGFGAFYLWPVIINCFQLISLV